MQFQYEFLESPAAIANELPAWNSIVSRFYQGFPHLSAEWTYVWLSHFAAGKSRIRCVKVTQGETVAGYFPLVESKQSFHHLPLTFLTFSSNLYSPISSPILDSQFAEAVFQYFASEILPQIKWDVFFWQRLPPEYLSLENVQSMLRSAGYLVGRGLVEGNWIYDHGVQTSAEYLASRKSNIRNDTRRMARKLEEQGPVEFRVFIDRDSSNAMDDYEHVYSRSWKPSEEDAKFIRDVVAELGKAEKVRIAILYVNQKPISAQLWYFAGHRGYMVKTAYDEAFKPYSPGVLLTWRMIQYLMDQDGMTSFDCLRGDDHYKRHWANERRERHNLYAFRRDLKGHLLYAFDQKFLPYTRSSPALTRLKRLLD